MTDRRKKQRFELRLSFEIVKTSLGLRTRGETINVSSSGVLFTAEERIAVGDSIDYLITFPRFRRTRRNVQLLCSGRVLREESQLTFAASLDRHTFAREWTLTSGKNRERAPVVLDLTPLNRPRWSTISDERKGKANEQEQAQRGADHCGAEAGGVGRGER